MSILQQSSNIFPILTTWVRQYPISILREFQNNPTGRPYVTAWRGRQDAFFCCVCACSIIQKRDDDVSGEPITPSISFPPLRFEIDCHKKRRKMMSRRNGRRISLGQRAINQARFLMLFRGDRGLSRQRLQSSIARIPRGRRAAHFPSSLWRRSKL